MMQPVEMPIEMAVGMYTGAAVLMMVLASSFSTPSSFFFSSSRIMALGVAVIAKPTAVNAPAMPKPSKIFELFRLRVLLAVWVSVFQFMFMPPKISMNL